MESTHCREHLCKPDETDLCACPCALCDLAYFQRNVRASIRLMREGKVRGQTHVAAMIDDESFFLPSKR